jgi:RHS repeat-associated protein
LVRITYSSTNNYTAFSYDGAGRRVRIQEIESGTATSDKRFVWDGLSIAELRAADGTTVQKRYYGSGFQVSGTSGFDNYFYVRDHLGSPRAVIDQGGVERGRWNFGLWGNRSSNQIVSNPVDADFGYTGHYLHERSGCVLASFRFYDPANARWLSRDPIGENGGINLYGYVANNPINMVDPLGLATAGSLSPSGAVAMAEIAAMEAGGTVSPLAAAAIAEPVKPVVSAGIFVALKEIYEQLKPAPVGPPPGPPRGPTIGAACPNPPNGENEGTARGREAHKWWRPPEGYVKEFRFKNGMKADALNHQTRHIIELKPNDPASIAKGQQQIQRYINQAQNELGGTWTGSVVTY